MFEFIKNFFKKAEVKAEEAVAPYKVEAKAIEEKVVAEVKAVEEKVVAEVKEAVAKVKKPRAPRKPKAKS